MNSGMGPRRQTIPVILLVKTAFQLLWQQRDDALRLGLVPTLLLFGGFLYVESALQAISELIQAGMAEQVPTGLSMQLLFFALIQLLATCLVTVNWLRFLLLGPMGAVGIGLSIGRAHVRFCLAIIAFSLPLSFALAAIVLPLMLLHGALSGLLILILFVGVVLLAARLVPYAVGLAIDQRMTLAQSWKASRGNAFTLAIGLILVHVPFALGLEILPRFLAATGFAALVPAGTMFILAVWLIADWICQASVLATAYRHMVGVRV